MVIYASRWPHPVNGAHMPRSVNAGEALSPSSCAVIIMRRFKVEFRTLIYQLFSRMQLLLPGCSTCATSGSTRCV